MTADDYQPTDADAPAEEGNWAGERVPPHDPLAEQSVLGGMMLGTAARDRDIIDEVAELLRPTDFYLPKHEEIAKAIIRLHRRQEPTDVIAVTAELNRTGLIRQAGGAEYLHDLTAVVPTSANAGYYAGIVAERAIMRRLVEEGTRIVQMGYASEGDPQDLVQDALTRIDTIASHRKVPVQRIGDTLGDLVEDLEKPPSFLPTPWTSVNDRIGGFERGGLYVFAARPGIGKSIAVLQCGMTLAQHGYVAFSSLEMKTSELQERLLASFGDIPTSSLRRHTLTEQDWRSASFARTKIVDAPLYVDATAAASMNHIRGFARAVGRHGPLAAIIVDYLQIVDASGESREQAVSKVALDLKHLAKELDIVVIAAAQLKRGVAVRGRRPLPTLEDLRESGGIENHADGVILMDRTQEDRKRGQITFIVGKHRHGQGGDEFQLRWEGAFSRISDLGWSPFPIYDNHEETA